jgi:hypothetical protein
MRFTPEILRKHAQLLTDKEAKKNRGIIAVYLRGSLLYGSPLIGGAGDIDLVFIHNSPPITEHQILKLTPEIHFDIEHHDQLLYRKPREVRLDPWLGPTIYDAKPLYDPRHFLDYTQAGARSNFDFPENVQARCKLLLEKARQFWMERQIGNIGEILVEFPAFLEALHNAANAVALLTGPPLPTRRLGMDFPSRAAAAGAPGLAVAFNHLLGNVSLSPDQLKGWLKEWDQTMTSLAETLSPAPLLVDKKVYYQAALGSMLKSERPQDLLWPLIVTWTEAINYLPGDNKSQLAWMKALTSLGFAGKDYKVRLATLDSFLEVCETLILGEPTGA